MKKGKPEIYSEIKNPKIFQKKDDRVLEVPSGFEPL